MITRDEWLKALGDCVRPCDPDSLTLAEIQQHYHVTESPARRRLKILIKQKKATQTWKRVNGRVVMSYKLL